MFTGLFGHRPSQNIFRFWDGSAYRRVDPIPTFKALEAACGGDVLALLVEMTGGGEDIPESLRRGLKEQQERATEVVIRAARGAFGVGPYSYDGRRECGLTDTSTVRLVADFVRFMTGLAAAAGPKSTWPGAASTPAGSATRSSAASGTAAG